MKTTSLPTGFFLEGPTVYEMAMKHFADVLVLGIGGVFNPEISEKQDPKA